MLRLCILRSAPILQRDGGEARLHIAPKPAVRSPERP